MNLPPSGAQAALQLAEASTGQNAVARLLGWTISGVTLATYSPMIFSLLQTGKTQGLSKTTWLLQLFAFSAAVCYPVRQGYPLSSYFDMVALAAQAVAIVAIVFLNEGFMTLPAVVTSLGALVLLLFAITTAAPLLVVTALQAGASATMLLALLPQVVKNFRSGSNGGWSPISAGVSTVGNSIRVFTTLKLTGDPILLAQFGAGMLLNAVLFLQAVLLPGPE